MIETAQREAGDAEGRLDDAEDRLDHEVRRIVLRDPVPKIGRQQKPLVPLAVDKFARREIPTENHPKVRQTAIPEFSPWTGAVLVPPLATEKAFLGVGPMLSVAPSAPRERPRLPGRRSIGLLFDGT